MTIPAAPANAQADRFARVQYACATILGLNLSTARYDACVRSLNGWVPDAPKGNEVEACRYVGIRSTNRGFEECAAQLRATLWNQENLGAR